MNTQAWRLDFPALTQSVHGHPLVYLDSAASALKPRAVIDAMAQFDAYDYSNIHRGVHALSQRATDAYESVRDQVKDFIHAAHRDEIVFTSGTTAAINGLAQSYGRAFMQSGDEVIITAMEHHANIVPWHMLRDQMGIQIKVWPMSQSGELDLNHLNKLIGERTRLIAMTHVSNVLGTINDIASVTRMAHERGVHVLVDGAQAVAHQAVDVQALGCDFYVFSGHKLYGPTGVGVSYGRKDLLSKMPPVMGGGDMIQTVTLEQSTYREPPYRFEAGTPPITQVIGLGAAMMYVDGIGFEAIQAHEAALIAHARQCFASLPACRCLGPQDRAAVFAYVTEGVHAHDVGTILDQQGVAVRVGHHCAMPIVQFYGVPATTRLSFGVYNQLSDVQAWFEGMQTVMEVFGHVPA